MKKKNNLKRMLIRTLSEYKRMKCSFSAWQKFLSVLLLIIVFTILELAKAIAKIYPRLPHFMH